MINLVSLTLMILANKNRFRAVFILLHLLTRIIPRDTPSGPSDHA